ncbi:MAG: 4Fe-4S dicluster domain-containing protein, partial [Thioalkalispiraceae bacterium]
MQTRIPENILNTYEGHHADQILRTCVHCGFCIATCPTYQLLGDELDSPRGRIYLMKKVFEGEKPTLKTLTHLDRCLTCRSCETTCPSGVEYARLLDLGRHFVESRTQRSLYQRLKRNALHWLLTRPRLFARLYRFVATLDPILPHSLRTGAHSTPAGVQVSGKQHTRSILLLQGCVQPAMAPNINTATQKILDKMGINTIILDEIECCGAISHHLNKQARALKTMRN